MDIEVVGTIKKIVTSCACGHCVEKDKICPQCRTPALHVVTITNVSQAVKGEAQDPGFFVKEMVV